MGIKTNIDEMIAAQDKIQPRANAGVEVGFFSGTYISGVEVPSVAFWLEFGTEKMTPKYFMTRAWLENEEEFKRFQKKLHEKVMAGEISSEHALDIIGQKYQALIQEQITKQGHIDTGRLRQSVTYEVKK